MSDNLSIRLSGGLRYAALEENYQFSSSTTTSLGLTSLIGSTVSTLQTTTTTIESESDFWGIGPRLTAAPIWKPFHNTLTLWLGIPILKTSVEYSYFIALTP